MPGQTNTASTLVKVRDNYLRVTTISSYTAVVSLTERQTASSLHPGSKFITMVVKW